MPIPNSRPNSHKRASIASMAVIGLLAFPGGQAQAQQSTRESEHSETERLQTDRPEAMLPWGGLTSTEIQPNSTELPDQWSTNLDEAKATSKESGKPLLVVFSDDNGPASQLLIEQVYADPDVVSELEEWIPVQVNTRENMELARSHEVETLPTFVVIDSDGEEVGRFEGAPPTADRFLMRLKAAVDYEEKLADAEEAVKSNPDDSAALHRLGDLKMIAARDSESFMEAVDTYKKAIAKDSTKTGNIDPGLAGAIVKSVETDQQVAEVTKQIEESPENPALYKKRADLKAKDPLRTDSSEVIADYREAASLDPENETGAAVDLAFLEIQNGLQNGEADRAQAMTQLEKFESDYPESDRLAESRMLRAYLQLQSGAIEEGSTLLRTIVEEHPDHEVAGSANQLLAQIAAQIQMQQQQMQMQQQQPGASAPQQPAQPQPAQPDQPMQ